MGHRQDPMQGIYTVSCQLCGQIQQCRLVQHGDRYVWRCLGYCDEVKK